MELRHRRPEAILQGLNRRNGTGRAVQPRQLFAVGGTGKVKQMFHSSVYEKRNSDQKAKQ